MPSMVLYESISAVNDELDIKLLLASARPHIAPIPPAFPWNGKDHIFEGYVPFTGPLPSVCCSIPTRPTCAVDLSLRTTVLVMLV